ncbi:MAG: hypothetical protein AAFP03_03445 [Cyanobacteria bacterium J06598_3]
MSRFSPFLIALAAVLSLPTVASAQVVARTPLAAPVQMQGQTGGPESSSCGNIDRSGGQRVRVTEAFASLSFEVESEGDYTLFITGPGGFSECVFAHNYDGGVIQAPGLLNQGEYRVFIGDRSGESNPYTLSISQ